MNDVYLVNYVIMWLVVKYYSYFLNSIYKVIVYRFCDFILGKEFFIVFYNWKKVLNIIC